MDIKATFRQYGGWSFEYLDTSTVVRGEPINWLIDSNGVKGKIKNIGTNSIVEHGFTGVQYTYTFIDENLNVRNLISGEIFSCEKPGGKL